MLRKITRRIVLLAAAVCLCATWVLAADSGSCGENATWELSDGVLTISGTGSTPDYYMYDAPWYDHSDEITAIVVEEGITRIGNCAFVYEKNLESVTLPDTLESLGSSAIYNCTGLTGLELPESLQKLGYSTFGGTGLTSIRIPEGITTLPDNLFYGCTALEEVILPEGLESIGENTFFGCAALKEISIPHCVTSLGSGVFAGSGLTTVTLPDGITAIPEHAFSACKALASIEIPEGVTAIGACAFQECESLTAVTLPESLETIDYNAFCYTGLESVVIPDGVTTIGKYAFGDCRYLRSAVLGSGITALSDSLFNGCYSLIGVQITGPVTSIGNKAFHECEALTGISIPDGVTTIGDYAFDFCWDLEDISLPASLTAIGNYAFSRIRYLKNTYFRGTQAQWDAVELGEGVYLSPTVDAGAIHIHDLIVTPGRDATCTEDGATEQISCGSCGQLLVKAQILPAGHSFVDHILSPTPEETGWTEHFCTVCGYSFRDGETEWAQSDVSPVLSNNQGCQDYAVRSSPITSHLVELEDGNLLRVEYQEGSIWAEAYNSAGDLLAQHRLTPELPLYGGFHATEDHYFLVWGQTNFLEVDTQEVIRIVKYDHQWNRLDSVSIFGANTSIPFDAGTLRFAHSGDILYLRTCHEMYRYSDGLHHQANMTITLHVPEMKVLYNNCYISNNKSGYVSHSFDQYIIADEDCMVAADHGDGHPRAAVIFRYKNAPGSWELGYVENVQTLRYQGEAGENTTGASLGGFEASSTHYLLAGNSVDQAGGSDIYYGQRNIFLIALPKDSFDRDSATIHWLTKYSDEDYVEISVPHLVKLDSDRLMLLWTEGEILKYALVGSDSSLLSEVFSAEAPLSDCKPIFADGKVVWYATDGYPVFYTIDPEDPQKVQILDTDPCSREHDYTLESLNILTAPSDTQPGWISFGCSRCGHTLEVELPPLTEKDYYIEIQPSTCSQEGWEKYTWHKTDEFYLELSLPLEPHTWDEGVETLAPTEDEPGIITYTCTVCGATDETITVLAHVFEEVPARLATYTQPGNIYHWRCTMHGELVTDPESLLLLDPVEVILPKLEKCDFYSCYSWRFNDVSRDSWFHDAVDFAMINKLMNGVAHDSFAPNDPCNRAMLVTILWRMEGSPAPASSQTSFTDLEQDWYIDAVKWASEQGIVTGKDAKTFAPNDPVTREQIAAILYRYSKAKGFDISKTTVLDFPDLDKLSDYAREPMAWANANYLITGNVVNNQFCLDPGGNATRAQVATILMRFVDSF